MPTELIEHPHILPTLDAQATSLALHSYEENPGALLGYPMDDETKSTEEQSRLLLSWRAVLGQIRHGEAGAGRW